MRMIVYRSQAANFVADASDDRPFRKILRSMGPWRDIKVVWRGLKRAQGMFARLGLKYAEFMP